jgi:cytochrome c-type biogenesis protein CcmF
MVLMAVGIVGINLFQLQTQGTLPVDGSLRLGDYSIKYQSIAQFTGPDNREVTRAVVGIYDTKGGYLGELHPRIDYYPDSQQNMTIPGERGTLKDDLYVLLVDWQPANASGATFKVFVNPLVNWLWIGALLFLVGILIAAWPEREAEVVSSRIRGSRQSERRQASGAD